MVRTAHVPPGHRRVDRAGRMAGLSAG